MITLSHNHTDDAYRPTAVGFSGSHPFVSARIDGPTYDVSLFFTPAQARDLAAKLLAAADVAEPTNSPGADTHLHGSKDGDGGTNG
ncbi:MAG TPA: hypothetical protein VD948_03020 [Rhodothermales bacterium]|nr:hypothetical protein [Rhodothermales bacterium]